MAIRVGNARKTYGKHAASFQRASPFRSGTHRYLVKLEKLHRLFMFRCRYGVSYPTMYADASNKNANAFNCIQRGHQNSLEGFPLFLGCLLVAGVKVSRLMLAVYRCLLIFLSLSTCCTAVFVTQICSKITHPHLKPLACSTQWQPHALAWFG